ncbi:hypothetical protein, conserved [Trypanosoma brucei brucei TREU927]|uniref:AAA+ ATPase domain-containing protein n=1 Tax=Trypanosoma brucei brucei (strain 927/4 GUTat10.1) TaxID=185431 RepID=Q57ZQ6_TRYB2|nr:hypothetical protein, conserved [Trypanosoma brucei brucei TREU927]AAX79110.1 hypothetical protein, conserved [Trypanosoma brucei]AAZ11302.1 hypothetical protein, conserved [Trypanosoma brucei brucei TREU927]
MLSCLRQIHHRKKKEPCVLSTAPAEEGANLLRRAVYDTIVSSEHHHIQTLQESQRIIESSEFETLEEKKAMQRMGSFMVSVVQKHMQAVTFESTLAATCRKQQRQKPRGVSNVIMGSEEEVGQLLLMNRTMALGTTCTFLEGLINHDKELALAPILCTSEEREAEPVRHPSVQDPVPFLRQSHPALGAILLDTAEQAVGATQKDGRELSMTQGSGTLSQLGNRFTQSTLTQQREGVLKRRRQDDNSDNDNDGSVTSSCKRNPSFVVRIGEGVLKSRKQCDPDVEGTVTGSLPTPATDQTKRQETQRSEQNRIVQSQRSATSSQPHTQKGQPLPSGTTDENSAPRLSPLTGSTAKVSGSLQRSQLASGEGEAIERAENSSTANRRGDPWTGRHNAHGSRAGKGGDEENERGPGSSAGGFVTACEQLKMDLKAGRGVPPQFSMERRKPAPGVRYPGFTPPFQRQPVRPNGDVPSADKGTQDSTGGTPPPPPPTGSVSSTVKSNRLSPARRLKQRSRASSSDDDRSDFPSSLLLPDGSIPPILQSLDARLVAQVASEIIEHSGGGGGVGWNAIAGLEHAKRSVEEVIVWPLQRPEFFVGLRGPPRGLLLFGPPGTGKTMIARAIANRAQCTFFNISASSVMSKWMGDGEKLVRCLFAVAVVKQPSVIFIDEIDSLLSMRSEGEMDAVRRVKTEFLVQLDGVATNQGDRVLLIGATNRPDELDEAARRRLEKRLYIPLPDINARAQLIKMLLEQTGTNCGQAVGQSAESAGKAASSVSDMDEKSIMHVATATEGYSGSDIKQLCSEAAMYAVRELKEKLKDLEIRELRPIQRKDFVRALRRSRPSVGADEVRRYVEWNKKFGSFPTGVMDADEEEEEEDEGEGEGEATIKR